MTAHSGTTGSSDPGHVFGEIETLAEFDAVAAHRDLTHVVVQSLDLRDRDAVLGLRAAFEVRDRFVVAEETLGVPTWFYGHEPPNVFATHIAKFCSNALREDVLLRSCKGGLVYLPGAAGTVQELFQAVTGNYYAADRSAVTPLVLVGTKQWTHTLPAWPLLHSLAQGRPMEHEMVLVESIEEAGEWLGDRWRDSLG